MRGAIASSAKLAASVFMSNHLNLESFALTRDPDRAQDQARPSAGDIKKLNSDQVHFAFVLILHSTLIVDI